MTRQKMRTIRRAATAVLASPDGTDFLGWTDAARDVAKPDYFVRLSAARLQRLGGCTQGISIPGCDRDGPRKLQDPRFS